jgi:hypothetical protein
MKQPNKHKLPKKLEYVRRDFEAWREKRRKGERIPDTLWAGAALAVKECGVSRVSGALGLDYYKLKKRAGLREEAPGGETETDITFAELSRPTMNGEAVCVVELEKGNGTRMRICLAEPAVVDWGQLTDAFLKA